MNRTRIADDAPTGALFGVPADGFDQRVEEKP
jgi:hypothetical protein